MRNVFLMMVLVAAFGFAACAQTAKDVPAKVTAAFSEKFPDAKKVKWDKENDQEWEVEFKMNGKEYSANFNVGGMWMETEYEISKKDIPAAVQQTLDTDFAGYKIEEAEISETADGAVYEFEIEKDKLEMEVVISPAGEVVKKMNAPENEDHDENGEDDD
jgi:uncharacterized membrane protein YkoI